MVHPKRNEFQCSCTQGRCATPQACEIPEKLRAADLERQIAGKQESRPLVALLLAKGSMTGPFRREKHSRAIVALVSFLVGVAIGAPLFLHLLARASN